MTASSPIQIASSAEFVSTDASSKGEGAVYKDTSTGGQWSSSEELMRINLLELKAILLAMQSFFTNIDNMHIRVNTDNTTAVAYINNLGGVQSLSCHEIVKSIWKWAILRNNYIYAEHLPGSENILADRASTVFDGNTEWSLHAKIFQKLMIFFMMNQTQNAIYVDAFSQSWRKYENFYCFPPFTVVMKCLGKITLEES